MRINELIVGLNSLEWDIDTKKNLNLKNREYYTDIIGEVQEILLNLDR
jgi:hypothetical protein